MVRKHVQCIVGFFSRLYHEKIEFLRLSYKRLLQSNSRQTNICHADAYTASGQCASIESLPIIPPYSSAVCLDSERDLANDIVN